jgi:ligand-binding SRPBCC domain-containing protein
MPYFHHRLSFARAVALVFDFFCQPSNWVRIAPPDLHLRLVEGPERIHRGASLTLKGRRWGMPQRVVSEITTFEPKRLIVQEQRQGPLSRWIHTQRFEEISGGTSVDDEIDYEPPGGVLGLTVTAAFLARDLMQIFAFRTKKLRELLGNAPEPGN